MNLQKIVETDSELLKNSENLAVYFANQLNLIKDLELRNFVFSFILDKGKFKMEKPTSSTGKYHPDWQNGYGGNGRHTKNVVKILQVFERAYPDLDWDSLYIAGILHDLSKYETEDDKHTNANHPKLAAEQLWSFYNTHKQFLSPVRLKKRQIKFICNLIQFHDGRFNSDCVTKDQIKNGYTKGMRKKLRHVENYILHSADMISANKALWDEII